MGMSRNAQGDPVSGRDTTNQPLSRRGVLTAMAGVSGGLVSAPLTMSLGSAATPTADPLIERTTAVPAWTELFDRTDPDGMGWLAADGIYSVALNGIEYSRTAAASSPTLLWFSDTVIGSFEDGDREETTLVNNSLAVIEPFEGDVPTADQCQFYYATDANGDPTAVFTPETPTASSENWYWPKGGFVDPSDGSVRVFAMRMRDTGAGAFGFATDGMALLTLDRQHLRPIVRSITCGDTPANDTLLAEPPTQTELPVYEPGGADRGSKHFGDAILVNTAAAGAPDPDGYLYVYGLEDLQRETTRDNPDKGLLVARVHPGNVTNTDAWRYWDGSAWSPELETATPVSIRASDEMSITPLSDGRYLHVFQLDTITDHVAVNVSERPQGPFGDPTLIYDSPVPERFADQGNEGVFAYNAKAHPHLSPPGELLISYNVNDRSNGLFEDTEVYDQWIDEVYQPRFVRMPDPTAIETPTRAVETTPGEGTEDGPARTATDTVTRPPSPTEGISETPPGTETGTGTERTEAGDLAGFGIITAGIAGGAGAIVAVARRLTE